MTVAVGGTLTLADVAAVAAGDDVTFPERARAGRRGAGRGRGRGHVGRGRVRRHHRLRRARERPGRSRTGLPAPARDRSRTRGCRVPRRARCCCSAPTCSRSGTRGSARACDLMVAMLNADVMPAVPSRGRSAPRGPRAAREPRAAAYRAGRGAGGAGVEPGAEAMRRAGLEPLTLEAKEGLALVNGTQGMLAIGSLAADRLALKQDGGRRGRDDDRGGARDGRAVRLPTAAAATASRSGRERLEPPVTARRLADVASIGTASTSCRTRTRSAARRRCTARRATLAFAESVLETELNAISDNPIVLPDDGDIVSGGNFHGQPVAVAMDAVAAATVGMASISDGAFTGCSTRPVERAPGVPRAAERAEQRLHARPVHGRVARVGVEVARASGVGGLDPVVGRAEGPVSMGMTAARHARRSSRTPRRWWPWRRSARRGALMRAPLEPDPRRARCSRRCVRACRSPRRTASSDPTSTRPCGS